MNKKILLLIGLVFMLCGCSANVNIEINDSTIKEDVYIYAYPNQYYTKDQLSKAFREYIPAFSKDTIIDTMPDEKVSGVSYYTRSYVDLENGYRFNYKYNFNLSNYKDARTVKEGFKSSNVYVDTKERTILLSTDSSGLLYFNQYPDLNNVTINIKTDYKVKETNADAVSENVYTWNLNRNSNKGIYLLLSLDKNNQEEEEEPDDKQEDKVDVTEKEELKGFEKFFNEHPILTIFLGILLFIIIVFIVSKVIVIK